MHDGDPFEAGADRGRSARSLGGGDLDHLDRGHVAGGGDAAVRGERRR